MQVSRQKKTKRAARRKWCCVRLEGCLDAKLFRALGDPTRLHILLCLSRCGTPQSVSAVADCCSVDLSVVSRHLAALREAGVLAVEKQGRSMLYSVRFSELARSLHSLADAIEACCPGESCLSE